MTEITQEEYARLAQLTRKDASSTAELVDAARLFLAIVGGLANDPAVVAEAGRLRGEVNERLRTVKSADVAERLAAATPAPAPTPSPSPTP